MYELRFEDAREKSAEPEIPTRAGNKKEGAARAAPPIAPRSAKVELFGSILACVWQRVG
jgi:hypothetical protein